MNDQHGAPLSQLPVPGNIVSTCGDTNVAIGGDVTNSIIAPDAHFIIKSVSPESERRLHQLPAPLPKHRFIGRQYERKQIRDQLRKSGNQRVALAALKGMGGIGKTALTVYVANQLKDDFPNAQLFLDLRGTTQPLAPVDVMAYVIRSFRPDLAELPEQYAEMLALYRSVLSGGKSLLVLDNAADDSQIRDLVPPPPCGLIVTARAELALEGVLRVPLDLLNPEDARQLLRGIVGRNKATDAELDAIAELCGRLPLALRVAGDFLRIKADFTAEEYRSKLEKERLKRLKVGTDPANDVEAVLALSVSQLVRDNSNRASRWQMLSVFPADFDAVAAAAVWQMELDDPTAKDELSDLVDWSLIQFEETNCRYSLHDLLRLLAANVFGYSDAQAVSPGSLMAMNEARYRFAMHFRSILLDAEERYVRGDTSGGLALFDCEEANIRHGQAMATSLRMPESKVTSLRRDYAVGAFHVLHLRLHARECIVWLISALVACRQLKDRRGEGAALSQLGVAHAVLGDTQNAIVYYEQALSVFREVRDLRGQGGVLNNLGLAYGALGDTRKAASFFREWMELARKMGYRRGEANALGNLGIAYAALGDARKAIQLHEQRLVIVREIGDRLGEGNTLLHLGGAHQALGELKEAITCYEQQLGISREIGDRRGECAALSGLGLVYADLGDARNAITFHESSMVIAREVGDRRLEGGALGGLASAQYALGDSRKAIALGEQQLVIAREIRNPHMEAEALGTLAGTYLALGDPLTATTLNEQQLAIARKIGNRIAEANALVNLGAAQAAIGDNQKAIAFCEQSLMIAHEIGDRVAEAAALRYLGVAQRAVGETQKAAALHEEQLATAREVGDRRMEGRALGDLGNVHCALGDASKAIVSYERWLLIAREIGDRRGEGVALWNLAIVRDSLGEREMAIHLGEQALVALVAVEHPTVQTVRNQLTAWCSSQGA